MRNKKLPIAYTIVRESIHRIDPFNLLEAGAPDDEFDSVIVAIYSQLKSCNTSEDIANTIARVINKDFSENFKPQTFIEESEIIYEALVKNGLK